VTRCIFCVEGADHTIACMCYTQLQSTYYAVAVVLPPILWAVTRGRRKPPSAAIEEIRLGRAEVSPKRHRVYTEAWAFFDAQFPYVV
jgi:hypothetical protein